MGLVTTITAFFFLRRDMKRGSLPESTYIHVEYENTQSEDLLSSKQKKFFAILIPISFALDVFAMSVLKLQGGDATALIGGTAVFILIILTLFAHKQQGFEKITAYLIQGFQFGFKVFGPVIPIAAFFYLGDSGFQQILGNHLPKTS